MQIAWFFFPFFFFFFWGGGWVGGLGKSSLLSVHLFVLWWQPCVACQPLICTADVQTSHVSLKWIYRQVYFTWLEALQYLVGTRPEVSSNITKCWGEKTIQNEHTEILTCLQTVITTVLGQSRRGRGVGENYTTITKQQNELKNSLEKKFRPIQNDVSKSSSVVFVTVKSHFW